MKNAIFYKEIGSEARSSDLCGLRMRDVPHGVFVTLDSLTSSSTRCSTSDTAGSHIHYTCRVQQVRAGGIPGTELSHKILLYFKFHMVILDPRTLYTGIYWGGKTTYLVPQTGVRDRRPRSKTTVE